MLKNTPSTQPLLTLAIIAVMVLVSCGEKIQPPANPGGTATYDEDTRAVTGDDLDNLEETLCLGSDQDNDGLCDEDDTTNHKGEYDLSCMNDPYCLDPTREELDSDMNPSKNKLRNALIGGGSALSLITACTVWNKCRNMIQSLVTKDDDEKIMRFLRKTAQGNEANPEAISANYSYYSDYSQAFTMFNDNNRPYFTSYIETTVKTLKGDALGMALKIGQDVALLNNPIYMCHNGIFYSRETKLDSGEYEINGELYVKNTKQRLKKEKMTPELFKTTICGMPNAEGVRESVGAQGFFIAIGLDPNAKQVMVQAYKPSDTIKGGRELIIKDQPGLFDEGYRHVSKINMRIKNPSSLVDPVEPIRLTFISSTLPKTESIEYEIKKITPSTLTNHPDAYMGFNPHIPLLPNQTPEDVIARLTGRVESSEFDNDSGGNIIPKEVLDNINGSHTSTPSAEFDNDTGDFGINQPGDDLKNVHIDVDSYGGNNG